jgi:dTDP-4-amino-4,6-dideoxygalactose transaminase
LGDIGCTSFYPSKPLGCYGDGGMVFTDDDQTAALVRSLHVHGEGADRYENVRIGICGRLDAIQAAVLLGKLPAFEWEVQQRQRIAQRYTDALQDVVVTPAVRPGNRSVWAQYSIRVPDRTAFRARLAEAGIPTAVFYPKPLHLQDAFVCLGHRKGDMPVAERVACDIVSLPMHAYLDEPVQDRIIEHVRKAVAGQRPGAEPAARGVG